MMRRLLPPATGPLDGRFAWTTDFRALIDQSQTYRAHAPSDDLQQLTTTGSQVVARRHRPHRRPNVALAPPAGVMSARRGNLGQPRCHRLS
jgi:hypothetical protein